MADNERSFYNMADINRAHVLMLVEENIISKDVGAELLKALNKMRQEGSAVLEMHPEYEDYYFNIEKIIIAGRAWRSAERCTPPAAEMTWAPPCCA